MQKPRIAINEPVAEAREAERDLQTIADIRAGARAIRAKGATYLPRFQAESNEEFQRRLNAAPWRPEFVDALAGLVGKTFAKPITLASDARPEFAAFAEDVDTRGNSLTTFARAFFEDAMADGWSLLMIDFPDMRDAVTRADEIAAGARPYWIRIKASDVLSMHVEQRGGREVITHIRIRETDVVSDGEWGTRVVERIRVLEPGLWRLYEKSADTSPGTKDSKWDIVGQGELKRGGGKIDPPIVRLYTGERTGTFTARPPLMGIADMQIELYRSLSRQEEILTHAGHPMLKIIGMEKPETDIEIGPKRALFLPAGEGRIDAGYISPDAALVREIRDQIRSTTEDLRRLAMQPMVTKAGSVTATATAIDAAKGHSVLQCWAVLLKDALEQALVFTGEFLGVVAPGVHVHTDFGTGTLAIEEARALVEAKRQNVLSAETVRDEFQRRGILGPDFDPAREAERMASENEPLMGESDIDPATGQEVREDADSATIRRASEEGNVVSILSAIRDNLGRPAA